jgi:hypothetical protein
MDHKLSLGLFIGLIFLGVGFMVDSECIGIGFFVLAIVWGILFVNPKSPIRRWCWSASDKLSIAVMNYGGFPPQGNRRYLTIYATLRALSPIRVDKMLLSIGRKKILHFDWKSHNVNGDESGYVDFNRPEWLRSGNHSARVIAYTPYGYSKSEKFIIAVRD